MAVIKKFKFWWVDYTLPDWTLTINRKNWNTVVDTVSFSANQTTNATLDLPTDIAPTENSTNLVTSWGVFDAINTLDTGVSSVAVNGWNPQTWAVNLTNIATTTWTNNFTWTNTFNSNLPTSTKTPTASDQLTTKYYVDNAISDETVTIKSPDTTTTIGTFTLNQPSSWTITLPSAWASTYWMVKIDSVVTENSTNAVTSDAVFEAIQALWAVYRVKGSCTRAQLQALTDQEEWDVWNVTDREWQNYVWTWTVRDPLWATIDTSDFARKSWTNAFTWTNTFNVNLPTSTLTPTSGNDLTNKTYVDWRIATTSDETSATEANVLYIITQ